VKVIIGEESSTSSFSGGVSGGGGGGGCSIAPSTPASSGILNLVVLFSGLLGLFGFRRKKN
jgi:hypothetical protein